MRKKLDLNKFGIMITLLVVMFSIVGVAWVASATPSQNPIPALIRPGSITDLWINATGIRENGTEIAVWDPNANPTFPVSCPLPDQSGGTKWQLMADVSNNGSFITPASYDENDSGTIDLTGFGDGSPVTVITTNGAQVFPTVPDPTKDYKWVNVGTGQPGTDSTGTTGVYKFASCGIEGTQNLGFEGTALFQVIVSDSILTKSASPTNGIAPLTVTYTYTEQNTGSIDSTLSNVTVTDDTCSPVIYSSGGTMSNGKLTLAPGQTATFTCTMTFPNAGTFTNTATANATDPLGTFVTAPAFPSERAQATVTVIHPQINLTKTPNVTKTDKVTPVTYTYVVTNTGDQVLNPVNIDDNVLGHIGGPITLNPGNSQTFTKTATLTSNTTNIATATGDFVNGTESGQISANATAFVRVVSPNISVTKSCSPKTQVQSGTITWTIVTTNTGDATLSNVTLADTDSSVGTIVIGTLAPGASNMTTIMETSLGAGSYTNMVTATGNDQLGIPVSATSSDTCIVTALATPALGRMTGGGSVFNTTTIADPITSKGTRVTHGFELHCNASKLPNNLEVNWAGHKFHLVTLTNATCINDTAFKPNPPAAPFNTYYGNGTGDYNGVPGAHAKWIFTDAGEPGTKDTARIDIWDANNIHVLSVFGNLDKGNQQAHAGDP